MLVRADRAGVEGQNTVQTPAGTLHWRLAAALQPSYRDWAAERTAVPRKVWALALTDTNSGRVKAAYHRSD
ncbi:MAG: hypothetical protein OXI33_06310 [Chloroflexota bacterium]|nr:hypothetical protein [Chloroflexota bacterium]